MLLELRLENYAVIDHLAVEFAPGLNLLTGETGAGKSILIDALALLMGDKASPDVIRFGADRAVVSAVFEVEGGAEKLVANILEDNGLDSEDENLILRREISTGKGRAFINNQPATVSVLKQLAPYLASIHAQSESLLSFDGEVRLALLDSFAGTQLEPAAEAFAGWKQIRDKIAELEQGEQDRLRLVDLWTFQKHEIDDAKLHGGEDERLEAEKRVLANAERIYNSAMQAFDLLYEGSASTSATLRSAQKHLEELIRYEPKFREALASLESARINVEDVGVSLRDYAGGIEASPEHLAEIEDRLALLDRLKHKYGPTLEDVIELGVQVSQKLSEIENKDDILRGLRKQLATAADTYLQLSRAVSKKRYEAAKKLEKLVESEINELSMKAHFHIAVSGTDDETNWTSAGFDQVEYRISTNPGEPMHPLDQIASGGEMSRVMLALKATVEAGPHNKKASGAQRTLIFDEIDAGIGGRAAEAVGKKMKALARTSQVLCVTHLPQIATFADHHYLIEKKRAGERTKTSVRKIAGPERTEEVARMISGAKLTESSLKHAEQMLKANA
ncbi:MAG TPA: DNA repair protein RecN [Terriglobales bacterium]|nr:DNA repair protein RecN [Terriglobales bacterium]